MRKYKIVNKTRFIGSLVITLFMGILILLFFKNFVNGQNLTSEIEYKEIYIRPGDTVWNISLKYKPNRLDVRDMVANIREFNNLEDLSLKPGDIIKVPLKK